MKNKLFMEGGVGTEPFASNVCENAFPGPLCESASTNYTMSLEKPDVGGLNEVTPFPVSRIEDAPNQWSLSLEKRAFDVTCVILCMPLLVPILLITAIAVRLTSRGPVFFLQQRIGRFGKPFTILKFRTLAHFKKSARPAVTTNNCEEFTPVGRILRHAKLDELPQVINVLRGDMTMVGPRPKLPEHQIGILQCRPGITGAATIVFAREGKTLANIPKRSLDEYYREVVLPLKWQLDTEYMAKASFFTDLNLILCSVFRRWGSSIVLESYNSQFIERWRKKHVTNWQSVASVSADQ